MNVLERNFFTDPELLRDPDPYYAGLREVGPVVREPHHGVFLRRGVPELRERRHIAFGHGEHFCPGASLARTEARISFERLLARLDDLQLVDPRALSYAPIFIIRGLNDLPLRFRRRS